MSDQQATQHIFLSEEQANYNNPSFQTELLCIHVAMEMLEPSAARSSQSPRVTLVTLEPGTASNSRVDDVDVVYDHVNTNVDYEQCRNHYLLLSNTDQLQYDSLKLTTSSNTSNQYAEPSNNRDIVDDGNQSVSAALGRQNNQSITSQHHAESAPAAVEYYMAVLPDNSYGTATTYTQQLSNVIDSVNVLK
jgi:hypothetical protein